MSEQWITLNQGERDMVINHVRLHAVSRSCEHYNSMILTAKFKPFIKAKIMRANQTVLCKNKELALQQRLWKEKRKQNRANFQINSVVK
jgi:hypothetical protein